MRRTSRAARVGGTHAHRTCIHAPNLVWMPASPRGLSSVGGRLARASEAGTGPVAIDPRAGGIGRRRGWDYAGGDWSGCGMQCSSSSATTIRSRFSQVTSLAGSLRTLYSRNDCSRLS